MIRKYSKITRQEYRDWYEKNGQLKDEVREDEKRLRFHLMPQTGWMNDPNGLHQKDGTYRICYQYDPFDVRGELKLWGMYTTRDFIHYVHEEPVLYPDSDADCHGVYSGSAFVKDDTVYYFYTGNIKYFDRDDYDYINEGRGSNTILVKSEDGITMGEKKVLLSNSDYPSDMSCHVRDPKVFEHDGMYYMVLGARDIHSRGLVLVYRSGDLENWTYFSRITTEKPFGYMWECPDLFELDGKWILTCCPQGVEAAGVDYRNVHQTCWMELDVDFETGRFEVISIHQMDRGTDFYAQQSFVDESGRRIMFGWLGIPDADYGNREAENHWCHAMTLPRQLKVENGALVQHVIPEIRDLRGNRETYDLKEVIRLEKQTYDCEILFDVCRNMEMTLREGMTLSYDGHLLRLACQQDGDGRTDRSVACEQIRHLEILMDTTSVEIFVNHGQEVFTSRYYGMNPVLELTGECRGKMDVYDMNPFQIGKGLCAIGEALIDFVADEKGVPLKNVTSFTRAAGGAPANVAGTVAKLGLPSRFVTKLGKDAFGDCIVDTLKESGIDTSCIVRDGQYETSLAFVSLQQDGNREFSFYRKNSADLQYSVQDIPENILDGCGMVHFCSVDLVESPMKQAHRKLIEMAHEKGIPVCFDPNLRFSLWDDCEKLRDTVREFLPLAEVVKISDEELEFICGSNDINEALKFLLQGRTECVIYTMGGDGAAAYTGNSSAYDKGFKVDVVDTTGAGDSFIGAMEYQMLRDGISHPGDLTREELERYLRFANAYAAYTTTQVGALSSLADSEEMRKWMKKLSRRQ